VDADAGLDVAGAALTIDNQAITQTTGGQVTFAGNVDADAGLDVAGGALTIDNQAITQTTGGQVDFAGNVDASGGVDIDADNASLTIGAGPDLTILHNATNTVATSATGDFIIDNTNTTGSTILRLGTDTTATDVLIENNSEAALFGFLGAGDFQVGGSSGNSGEVLTSGGAGAAPTWSAAQAANTVTSASWDTDTGSLVAGEVGYINGNDSAEQADATSGNNATEAIGIAATINASTGTIVTDGDYTAAQFVTRLSLTAGDRVWVSKTAGALTNDVSGFSTGDTVIPMGRVRDASGYTGGTPGNSKADIVVQVGEPTIL
jgi:hypothetical protein